MSDPASLIVSRLDYHTPLTCCMPDCGEDLYLSWAMSIDLSFGNVTEDITPTDATTRDWKVECLAGHVILLPNDEPCEETATECATGMCGHESIDDDFRTFRRSDVERLMKLLITKGGGSDA